MTAEEVMKRLKLEPHPEGGYFRETFRDGTASTAIYYLLRANERSHWHRVSASEIWHWYAGASLELSLSHDAKTIERFALGPELDKLQAPQIVVPANVWQAAQSNGEFTLVGCTVSPAFTFDKFELAPPGWAPGATATQT